MSKGSSTGSSQARHVEVLRERQRVEMEIDVRRTASATRKEPAGFADDDRVRAGKDQDDVFQQARIGQELDAAVPAANVGHFVHEQVGRPFGGAVRCGSGDQRNGGVMIVDRSSSHVENALRVHAPVQQVTHPLLEHRRFADPPAAGNRVDPRLIGRQMGKDGVAIRDGQTAQLPKLRIHGAKQVRTFEMKVVRCKAGIGNGYWIQIMAGE